MKTTAIVLSALVVTAAVAPPVSAERPAQRRPTYEQCFQRGLARGFIVSVGDWRNLEKFIKECMAGKIPF